MIKFLLFALLSCATTNTLGTTEWSVSHIETVSGGGAPGEFYAIVSWETYVRSLIDIDSRWRVLQQQLTGPAVLTDVSSVVLHCQYNKTGTTCTPVLSPADVAAPMTPADHPVLGGAATSRQVGASGSTKILAAQLYREAGKEGHAISQQDIDAVWRRISTKVSVDDLREAAREGIGDTLDEILRTGGVE